MAVKKVSKCMAPLANLFTSGIATENIAEVNRIYVNNCTFQNTIEAAVELNGVGGDTAFIVDSRFTSNFISVNIRSPNSDVQVVNSHFLDSNGDETRQVSVSSGGDFSKVEIVGCTFRNLRSIGDAPGMMVGVIARLSKSRIRFANKRKN